MFATRAVQWVNGVEVVSHSGGHLPFEGDITDLVTTGVPNIVTVALNNTLTPNTLPPGTLTFGGPPELPEGYVALNYQFDFYNYAGLHRPVKLYTTPLSVHVDDITVVSSLLSNGSAVLNYSVKLTTNSSSILLVVGLIEKERVNAVSSNKHQSRSSQSGFYVVNIQGQFLIEQPRLWWPWTMNPDDPGYLYELEVSRSNVLHLYGILFYLSLISADCGYHRQECS